MGGQREGRGGGFHQRRQSKVRNKLVPFCKLSHFVYVLFVESRTSLHTPPLPHFSPETRNATRFFVPFSPRLSLSLHVQGISGGRKRERAVYRGKKREKGKRGRYEINGSCQPQAGAKEEEERTAFASALERRSQGAPPSYSLFFAAQNAGFTKTTIVASITIWQLDEICNRVFVA